MGAFDCRPLTRTEVARQLAEADIAASRAVPGATLYELKAGGREWLLIALPDGAGLSVDLVRPPPKRRRADPETREACPSPVPAPLAGDKPSPPPPSSSRIAIP